MTFKPEIPTEADAVGIMTDIILRQRERSRVVPRGEFFISWRRFFTENERELRENNILLNNFEEADFVNFLEAVALKTREYFDVQLYDIPDIIIQPNPTKIERTGRSAFYIGSGAKFVGRVIHEEGSNLFTIKYWINDPVLTGDPRRDRAEL